MDEKIDCKKLYDEMERLKELRVEFGRVYEEGLKRRDFGDCRPLFREIRDLLDEPGTKMGRFRAMNVAPELNHLKLREQYESQVEVAWKSGLFGAGENQDYADRCRGGANENQNGLRKAKSGLESVHVYKLPVIERGGKKYPMPSWQEVRQTLRKPENLEIIKEKSAQGFTKMLIVPFGYDLKTMVGKFKEKVRELDQAGLNPDGSSNPDKGIFGAGGEKVYFNREDNGYPVYIWTGWDESQLVYYPKQYDQKKHGGMNKDESIKINGAWKICFVEDMPVIPKEGKEIGGRKQIDRNGSCIKGQTDTPSIAEFKEAMDNAKAEPGKKKMENPANYRHERGQTPEQYLWMQLTSLLEKEKPVLMDYENGEWRGTYLTECYNISALLVPFANWDQGVRRISLDGSNPAIQFGDFGVRPAVNIIK